MKYNCKLVSFNQLLVTPGGIVEPLCNSCSAMDCSNPIHKKKVSILGLKKDYKLYARGGNFHAVIECEGYLLKKEEEKTNGNGEIS